MSLSVADFGRDVYWVFGRSMGGCRNGAFRWKVCYRSVVLPIVLRILGGGGCLPLPRPFIALPGAAPRSRNAGEKGTGKPLQQRTREEKCLYARLRTHTQPTQPFAAGAQLAAHTQPALRTAPMGPAWCLPLGVIFDLT